MIYKLIAQIFMKMIIINREKANMITISKIINNKY